MAGVIASVIMEVKVDLINVPIFLDEVCAYITWLDKFFVIFCDFYVPFNMQFPNSMWKLSGSIWLNEADKCVLSVFVLVT